MALATSAFAGPVDYSKEDKNPVAPPPPAECFGPGLDIGIFGSGYLLTHNDYRDNGGGGGGLIEYFVNAYVGVQVSYSADGPAPVHNVYEGDIVLRYPIQGACIAPYILLGGGGVSNSSNFGYGDAGIGIEARVAPHVGIFADGTYHWTGGGSGDLRDFTLVRLGVKYAF